MKTVRCPICRAAVALRPPAPTVPFCSERCRQIDLGRWLSESYPVPVETDRVRAEEASMVPEAPPDV